jgi:hypothetical protein
MAGPGGRIEVTTPMKRRRGTGMDPPQNQQPKVSSSSLNSESSCRGVDEITHHNSDDERTTEAGEEVGSLGEATEREVRRISEIVRVSVICGEEMVQVHLSSETMFHEFDGWVRSRFSLSSDTYGVRYLDESSQEIIPDFSSPTNHNLTVSILPILQGKSHSIVSVPKTECPKNPSIKLLPHLHLLSFSAIFPLTAFMYLVIFLAPNSPIPNPMNYFPCFSPILTFLGIENEVQLSLYRELVCTFIAWPVPYFFIRRSLNPDFGFALSVKKFGSDSFWGSLAACVLVLLRHFVKAQLSVSAEAAADVDRS